MSKRSPERALTNPESPVEKPKAAAKARANREAAPKAPSYEENQLVQITEKDRDITARVDSVNKKDGSYRLRVEGPNKDEFITRSGEELAAGEERAKRVDAAEKSYAKLAKAISERKGDAGLTKSLKENKAAYLRDVATGDEKDVGKSLGERVEIAAFAAEVKPKHKESLRSYLDLLDAAERKNAELLALGKQAKAEPGNMEVAENLLTAKQEWQQLTKTAKQHTEALKRGGLDVVGHNLDRKANRDALRKDAAIEGDPATLAHLIKPEHKEPLDAYLELLDATERENADVRALTKRVKADPENASLAKELELAKRDWDTLSKSAGRYRDTLVQNGLDISTYRLDRKANRDALRTSLDELAKPPRVAEADKPMAFEDYDTPELVDTMASNIRNDIKRFDTEKMPPDAANALDAKILRQTAAWAETYLRANPDASPNEVLAQADKAGLSEFLTAKNVEDLKNGVPADKINKTDKNEILARVEQRLASQPSIDRLTAAAKDAQNAEPMPRVVPVRRDARGRVIASNEITRDARYSNFDSDARRADTLSLGTEPSVVEPARETDPRFESRLPVREYPSAKRPSAGPEPALPFERPSNPFGEPRVERPRAAETRREPARAPAPQPTDEARYNNFDSPARRAETLWRAPNTEVARPEPEPQGILQRLAQSRLGKWGKRAMLALGLAGIAGGASRLGSEDAAPSRERIVMSAPEANANETVQQNMSTMASETPVVRARAGETARVVAPSADTAPSAAAPEAKPARERAANREVARAQAHIRELIEWVRNGSITDAQFARQMVEQERSLAMKQSVRFDAKEALARNRQIARDVRKGLKNADWVVAQSGASTEMTTASASKTERPAALQAILDRQAREKAEMESLGTFEEPEE